MSLTTRCPACGTQFRVVPDQLRISGGWVRCGHCAEVFDASAHLQPLATGQAPPLGSVGSAQPGESATDGSDPGSSGNEPASPRSGEVVDFEIPAPPVIEATPSASTREPGFVPSWDADADLDDQGDWPARDAAAARVAEAIADHHFSAALRRADASDSDIPADPGDDGAAGDAAPPGSALWVRQGARSRARVEDAAQPSSPGADEALDSVSFVQQARRREGAGARDLRPWAWIVLALLSVLLVAQWAMHQRDRLAMQWPQLRPALEALCAPLGCSIGAPRQIESIVIDASGFQRLRPDAYRLSVTLRNQAALDLAMPAFELTLTDTQDQPVLRRVLMPTELPGAPGLIGAGGEWSAAMTVAVAPGVAAGRVAGYRLLAFYP